MAIVFAVALPASGLSLTDAWMARYGISQISWRSYPARRLRYPRAMATTTTNARKIRAALRELALTYPGAHEDFPWGESVVKVNGKVFIFLGMSAEPGASFCLKLPHSGDIALSLPVFKPAGYGLGKSGWVQAKLDADDDLPPDLLREWLDESYRAVAPKKLSATLKPIGASPMPATKAKATPEAKAAPKAKIAAKPKAKIAAKAKAAPKAKIAAKAKAKTKPRA